MGPPSTVTPIDGSARENVKAYFHFFGEVPDDPPPGVGQK